MQKIFKYDGENQDELEKLLKDGYKVVIATPVLENSLRGGSYTSYIIMILEKCDFRAVNTKEV